MRVPDTTLGDFLVDAGVLSRGRVDDVLRDAQGKPLAQILVDRGMLTDDEVRRAAAHALGIPFVLLGPGDIDPKALELLPEPLCREHNLAAYRAAGGELEVALLDLDDLAALEPLASQLSHQIVPRLTTRESLRRALLSYQQHLKHTFGEALQRERDPRRLLTILLRHAHAQRANEVHLEPQGAGVVARYRQGGVLREAMRLPASARAWYGAVQSAANLASKTLPQEGKFVADLGSDTTLSVRVSSLPTVAGERLVLRLVLQDAKGYSLEGLGFHGAGAEALRAAVHARRGLVLVAGARGSGRTTLLYTLFDLAHAPECSLMSVEEQVAARLPYAAQLAANDTGLSMAAALRAALRQEPDVVMVDSIADRDTAALALSAAARGMLVFASLEASSASAALEAMRSLGASDTDLAHVTVVVGTALVRRLCTKQTRQARSLERRHLEPLEPHADFAKVLAALKDEDRVHKDLAWRDVGYAVVTGCSECERGYRGQVGVYEVVPLSQRHGPGSDLYLNRYEDALYHAATGVTSVAEALRLAEERSERDA